MGSFLIQGFRQWGGGFGPSHSAPIGGDIPHLLAIYKKYFSYFADISWEIGFFFFWGRTPRPPTTFGNPPTKTLLAETLESISSESLTLTTVKYFCNNHKHQSYFFQFVIIINVFAIYLNTYVMDLRHYIF